MLQFWGILYHTKYFLKNGLFLKNRNINWDNIFEIAACNIEKYILIYILRDNIYWDIFEDNKTYDLKHDRKISLLTKNWNVNWKGNVD